MWKFEHSDKIVELRKDYIRISSKLSDSGTIKVSGDIINHMAEQTGIPRLRNNCVLVTDIVGIMLPPNTWYKIKEAHNTTEAIV